jgi:hypothetical protein
MQVHDSTQGLSSDGHKFTKTNHLLYLLQFSVFTVVMTQVMAVQCLVAHFTYYKTSDLSTGMKTFLQHPTFAYFYTRN